MFAKSDPQRRCVIPAALCALSLVVGCSTRTQSSGDHATVEQAAVAEEHRDARIDSPYEYVTSLADALSHAKSGVERARSADSEYTLFLNLKLAKTDFRDAQTRVEPFAASADSVIAGSAEAASKAFAQLQELNDASIAQLKELLDAAPQDVRRGTVLEQIAGIEAAYNSSWDILRLAVMMSLYSIVDVEPTTGLMSRLKLTQEQRDEVMEKLEGAFGDEVKHGLKAGQTLLVASAASLYEVVSDPRRKSPESP